MYNPAVGRWHFWYCVTMFYSSMCLSRWASSRLLVLYIPCASSSGKSSGCLYWLGLSMVADDCMLTSKVWPCMSLVIVRSIFPQSVQAGLKTVSLAHFLWRRSTMGKITLERTCPISRRERFCPQLHSVDWFFCFQMDTHYSIIVHSCFAYCYFWYCVTMFRCLLWASCWAFLPQWSCSTPAFSCQACRLALCLGCSCDSSWWLNADFWRMSMYVIDICEDHLYFNL